MGEGSATPSFPCPCCGYRTLLEEPPYDICPFWEDDGAQFDDPSYAGGANVVSLEEARKNFRRLGASEERHVSSVRAPRPDELPS